MSLVQTTGLNTQIKPQRVNVSHLSVFQAPNHLENIIEQQLVFLAKKRNLSVSELINQYGDAVKEAVQQSSKNPDTIRAFEKVIARYQEQENQTNLHAKACFNPLITKEIAYVDKDSLSSSGKTLTKVSPVFNSRA